MDTLKEIARTFSIRIFAIVALLGAVVTFVQFQPLGILIAVLSIIGLYIQGSESIRAKKELEKKIAGALQEIENARKEAENQHKQALQEIHQARAETAAHHGEAMLEIDEARKDAARQYEEATREIKRAHAERFLLEAEKLATSLMEKDTLVNEAVTLYPDFRQTGLRQLGIEMSAAVMADEDYLKWKSIQAIRFNHESPIYKYPLEEEERTYFIEHAIQYLTETELQSTNAEEVGLVYLACMYGYRHQYNDMMLVLDKARQIGPIVQVMKDQYRDQPMLVILLAACGSDSVKVERLQEILELPQPTEQYFCRYISQEYPLTPNYKQRGEFSKWLAVRKPAAPGKTEMGSTIIRIAPENGPGTGTYAFYPLPIGTEDIVPPDKRVPVEELYSKISDLFILFAPIDGVYLRVRKHTPKPILRLG